MTKGVQMNIAGELNMMIEKEWCLNKLMIELIKISITFLYDFSQNQNLIFVNLLSGVCDRFDHIFTLILLIVTYVHAYNSISVKKYQGKVYLLKTSVLKM